MQERRHSIRHDLKWTTVINGSDITGANFAEEGVIENLSSTGAFLYLSRKMDVGTRINLAIKLPFKKENWMRYSARVVRVEEVETGVGVAIQLDENCEHRIGVGIKFDHLKPNFFSKALKPVTAS